MAASKREREEPEKPGVDKKRRTSGGFSFYADSVMTSLNVDLS